MIQIKLILCSSILFCLFSSSIFAEAKTNLSWVGFLKLPKKKDHKHISLSETKKPEFWQQWKKENKTALAWLPVGKKVKEQKINIKLVVPITKQITSEKKSRRRRK
jgi:hypothetical protein